MHKISKIGLLKKILYLKLFIKYIALIFNYAKFGTTKLFVEVFHNMY